MQKYKNKSREVFFSLAKSWGKMVSGKPVGKNITNGEDALFLEEQASCGNMEKGRQKWWN